jgi:hypothetical protein
MAMEGPSPLDIKARLDAERAGAPFVLFRDGDGVQHIRPLDPTDAPISIGRAPETVLTIEWDPDVSRLHAELEVSGGQWMLIDDGLSRNGSYVNGERLTGRRRLRDGDALRFGETLVQFRAPLQGASHATAVAADLATAADLTEAQRRVLIALCRPFKDNDAFATPATNQQIAGELFLSVDAVKGHLRTLFAKFGVDALPQMQKRVRLAERAFQTGVVTEREL